jgi:hypothetical protein
MRYLTCLPTNNDEMCRLEIVYEVFILLSTCFVYGVGRSIIDEYRILIMDVGLAIRNFILRQSGNKEMVYKASIAFNNCIRYAIRNFRSEMDCGGNNDVGLSLVQYALQSLTEDTVIVHLYFNSLGEYWLFIFLHFCF